MNPYDRIASAATRIATITSIIRTRGDDEVRVDLHGGSTNDLNSRVHKTASKFEKVASKMEGLI